MTTHIYIRLKRARDAEEGHFEKMDRLVKEKAPGFRGQNNLIESEGGLELRETKHNGFLVTHGGRFRNAVYMTLEEARRVYKSRLRAMRDK